MDNAPDTEESVVRHRDSDDAAEAVAEQLGGFEVEQDDTVPSGHLQVMLGADAPSKIPGLPAPAAAPLRRPSRRSRRRAYRASTSDLSCGRLTASEEAP